MLTAKTKHILCTRLGPIVKYSFSGGFYWLKSLGKFTPIPSYNKLIWISSYYVGQTFQLLLVFYLRHLLMETEIEDDSQTQNSTSRPLLIFCGLLFWAIITSGLSTGSLAIKYQHEMAETINQAIRLDTNLEIEHQLFKTAKESVNLELLVTFICSLSVLVPVGFAISFFHPADPVRNLLEVTFETEFNSSMLHTWIFVAFECWAGFCFGGILISHILTIVLTSFVTETWMNAFTPVVNFKFFISTTKLTYFTTKIGNVSETKLILVYRTLQILIGIANFWLAKLRFAHHVVSLHLISVLSAFVLIKNFNLLTNQPSLVTFTLILLIFVCGLTTIFVFYMECYFMDGLHSKYLTFRRNILCCCRVSSACNKEVKSFREISLQTAYPFCRVNKSTFPEWCDTAINNLINLLLSF